MKVLIIGRTGLLEYGGGDKVQIEQTAKELRNLGVEVDIMTGIVFDMRGYNVVHLFQLDWVPPEHYFNVKIAKRFNLPVVVSPIHHKVSDVQKFDDMYAFDFRRISKIIFKNQFSRDALKNIYRSFFEPKIFIPTLCSVLMGFQKMQKKVLESADMVLVQTFEEAKDLEKVFKLDLKNKTKKVVNGVSDNFIGNKKLEAPLDFKDYIITVGRIEPRKNQLSIIKAVKDFRDKNNTDTKLVIIGKFVGSKHLEYSNRFKKYLRQFDWIKHLEAIPYEDMPSYYSFAKVCVSASWFESTGLTSLEALYCGTNAVACGDQPKEYLGNNASYCVPESVDSISKAIKKEYFSPRPDINQSTKMMYTWKKAAEDTFDVYKLLVKK